MVSEALLLGRSRRPGIRWGMPDVWDLLLDSSAGDSDTLPLDLNARSICGALGSMFSFLLGVEGRGGDRRRMGDPSRVGDPDFAGGLERIGD